MAPFDLEQGLTLHAGTLAAKPHEWGLIKENLMVQPPSPLEQLSAQNAHKWVRYLPDGAISLDIEASTVVLRASTALQNRFDMLLDKRKAGTLSSEEMHEYEAICDLDKALSWLNRLARSGPSC
jgi:hypothetical protein